MFPALAGRFLTTGPPGKSEITFNCVIFNPPYQQYLNMELATEKNSQCESCELSFIQGKMRTIAPETAFLGLRNCSKEIGQKVSIYET